MDRPGPRPHRGASLDEVLAHFGVRGMRWGVKRKSSTRGPSSPESKQLTVTKTVVRKSGVKAVSNKDLQDAITRMSLEKQFKSLSPTAKQQVGQFIAKTLLGIGKQEASKLASDVAAKQVANLLKK
jgi:hypothetical protein